MLRTVIIAGPQGIGKTRHGNTLQQLLGCSFIVDEYDPAEQPKAGGLHFSLDEPELTDGTEHWGAEVFVMPSAESLNAFVEDLRYRKLLDEQIQQRA